MEESQNILDLRVLNSGEDFNAHVRMEDGTMVLGFEDVQTGKGSVEARVVVDVDIKGVKNRGHRFSGRLNLLSLSGQESFCRNLKSAYGKDIPWGIILSEVCEEIIRKFKSRFSSGIRGVEDPGPDLSTPYLLHPYVVKGASNMLFGMGGNGKTWLALRMGMCVAAGQPFPGGSDKPTPGKVLFLDYENTKSTFNRRVHRLRKFMPEFKPEHDSRFCYASGGGVPIHELKDNLRRVIQEGKFDLLIVDSVGFACGGKLEDNDIANRLFNTLSFLDTTTLLIAHETKAENHLYAFGSIFFNNGARNIWNIRSEQDQDTDIMHAGMFHRKANDDRPLPLRSFRVYFGPDRGIDINPEPPDRWEEELDTKKRLLKLLGEAKREMDTSEVYEALPEVNRKTVERNLTELNKEGVIRNPTRGKWVLAIYKSSVSPDGAGVRRGTPEKKLNKETKLPPLETPVW